MWFFPALFWTEILFAFLRKHIQKAFPIAIIGCVVCAAMFSSGTNYQSGFMKIPSAMFAIGFYYCGYVTQQYNLINWVKRVPLLVYLVLHLALLVIFHPGLSLNTANTSNLLMAYMIAVIGICGVYMCIFKREKCIVTHLKRKSLFTFIIKISPMQYQNVI